MDESPRCTTNCHGILPSNPAITVLRVWLMMGTVLRNNTPSQPRRPRLKMETRQPRASGTYVDAWLDMAPARPQHRRPDLLHLALVDLSAAASSTPLRCSASLPSEDEPGWDRSALPTCLGEADLPGGRRVARAGSAAGIAAGHGRGWNQVLCAAGDLARRRASSARREEEGRHGRGRVSRAGFDRQGLAALERG
jgi:hypothetical protein